ncbi:MAG: DUF4160 domain-containing protein [Puniceicoccaceae bacterium]
MPTLFRKGPYRIFIYASDGNEPMHVHVQREGRIAKFWIRPVWIAQAGGFTLIELRAIMRIIRNEQA